MLLKFQINKQLIIRTDCEIPVEKSENYLFAQFSFSDEWQGIKTAIFNNGTPYSIQLNDENKCLVPWEVITAGGFSVSVFCGKRITANVAYVNVLPSGYIEGETPQPPSETVYEQIMESLDSKLESKNVKAGENVNIDYDGEDVIINAEGGANVKVDDETLENDNGTLKVKSAGIDTAQIKNGAVTSDKLEAVLLTLINSKITENRTHYNPPSATVSASSIAIGLYVAESSFTLRIHSSDYDIPVAAGDTFSINYVNGSYIKGYVISSDIYFFEYADVDDGVVIINTADLPYGLFNVINDIINLQNEKIAKQQSPADEGKALIVGSDGEVNPQPIMPEPITVENTVISTWSANSDTGYSNYDYKYVISKSGVTSSMLATVILTDELAQSGNYAVDTGTDSVTIYAKVNTAITIPLIVIGAPIEVNEKHNYSTKEQIVGTWIDGKPLYERTIFAEEILITTADSSQWKHGIDNLEMGIVKNAYYDFDNSGWKSAENIITLSNDSYVASWACNSSVIYIAKGSWTAYAERKWLAIVQYTKTTD